MSGFLYYVAVFLQVADNHRYLSRLYCAASLAWASQLQVDFGYLEAVVGAAHCLDAFFAVVGEFVVGDEYAV